MRKWLLFILLMAALVSQGQDSKADSIFVATRKRSIDSLHRLFLQQQTDTGEATVLRLLGSNYRSINKDSALRCFEQALTLSKKANDIRGQTEAVRLTVDFLAISGDYTKSIELALSFLRIAEQSKDTMSLFWATRAVWRSYSYMLEHSMVLGYARKAKSIVHSGYFKKKEDIKRYAIRGYMHAMAVAYEGLNNRDSAIYYGQLAYETARSLNDTDMLTIATHNLGDFYRKSGQHEAAFSFYRMTFPLAIKANRNDVAAGAHLGMATLFAAKSQIDSALNYGHLSLKTYQRLKSPIHELLATTFLSEVYAKKNQIDSAYKYQSLAVALQDSLFNQEKTRQVKNIGFNETLRLQQLEQERKEVQQRYNTQLKMYGIAGGLVLLLSIAFFLYRIRQLKQENQLKTGFTKRIQQMEMRALRAQMNPHFIFNCLNSINRYIVKSDHKTASNFLTKFARLIRLILDNSASENITLDKEIQTLQLYIEMELLRFDKVFDCSIEVDEEIRPESISIPSMLLQPYVENAIWHGLLHRENGRGNLWIRFRQPSEDLLIAEIEDNGIGREKAKELRSKEAIKKKSYGMQISKDRIFLINELYNTNANVQVKDLTDDQGAARGTKVTVEIRGKVC